MSGGGDQIKLLRSNSGSSEDDDIEGQNHIHTASQLHIATTSSGKGITDLIKRLDRRFSSPRRKRDQVKTHSRASSIDRGDGEDELGDGAPPEWALLLLGCLLGLATGLCVAGFNRGVSVFVFYLHGRIIRNCRFLSFVRVI